MPRCAAGRDGQLVLQRRLTLAPGESVTVPLVYGYEASDDADDAAVAVIGRYRGRDLLALFASQSEARQREGLRFSISGAPEVGRCPPPPLADDRSRWVASLTPTAPGCVVREVAWNYGAAAAAWSFDTFFGEHILTQGTAYT